jgi:hypothetical protein
VRAAEPAASTSWTNSCSPLRFCTITAHGSLFRQLAVQDRSRLFGLDPTRPHDALHVPTTRHSTRSVVVDDDVSTRRSRQRRFVETHRRSEKRRGSSPASAASIRAIAR